MIIFPQRNVVNNAPFGHRFCGGMPPYGNYNGFADYDGSAWLTGNPLDVSAYAAQLLNSEEVDLDMSMENSYKTWTYTAADEEWWGTSAVMDVLTTIYGTRLDQDPDWPEGVALPSITISEDSGSYTNPGDWQADVTISVDGPFFGYDLAASKWTETHLTVSMTLRALYDDSGSTEEAVTEAYLGFDQGGTLLGEADVFGETIDIIETGSTNEPGEGATFELSITSKTTMADVF